MSLQYTGEWRERLTPDQIYINWDQITSVLENNSASLVLLELLSVKIMVPKLTDVRKKEKNGFVGQNNLRIVLGIQILEASFSMLWFWWF